MMVREYDPGDLERLYEILCSSLDESYDRNMIPFFHLQWPKGQLVVCDFSGRPIGFLSASKVNVAHVRIMLFAVDRDHRSMGLGSKLMIQLKHIALMNGIVHMSLEVRPSNMRAVNFYKRHGFVPTEVLKSYYNDGGDAIKMDMILS